MMQTPKYIIRLAHEVNTSTWLSDAAVVEQLLELRAALLDNRYYTRVESVAASGMSRTIAIATIQNNSLLHVTYTDILKLAGCDKTGRMTGCGMDMLFAAQYNLFVSLCPNHKYQTAMTRYRAL